MKWYHVIRHDNAVDDPYIAGTGDLMGVEQDDLWSGKLITNNASEPFSVFPAKCFELNEIRS